MTQKIAVIKTGWSADFMGSPVEAAHKHVRRFKDGHEKFNFQPAPDGRYYAYTPPVGPHEVAPQPKELDDWLVFSLAKSPNRAGLYLTGWFENASFAGEYIERPDYQINPPALPLDDQGHEFVFTVSAPAATRVDPAQDPYVFTGDRMKRSSVFYLRGNGQKDNWRDTLADKLLGIRARYQSKARPPVTPVDGSKEGGICGDAARRKEVEEAAICCVKAHYPEPKFSIDDKQKANCGFDLLIRPARKPRDELHIEVKGTQNPKPHFLMSRPEYLYMLTNQRHWRLAMVTNALSDKPTLEIMDAKAALARFFWSEFTWHATPKPEPDNS